MKMRVYFLFLMAWFAGIAAANEGPHEHLNIGFSADYFFEGMNRTDAEAAMKVWTESIARNQDETLDINVSVYDGEEQLANALAGGQVDLVIVLSTELLSLRRKELLIPEFVSIRNGQAEEEYLVLVRQDSGIENLAGLKQKKMIIQSTARTSVAIPWLERTLQRSGCLSLDEELGSVAKRSKVSEVLLPVFFGKADACMLTRNSYNTMCEFNPQLRRQLLVLAASPGYVPTAICMRTDYQSTIRQKLLESLATLHSEPRGQQVLTLFKVDGLTVYDDKYAKTIEELFPDPETERGGSHD